MTATIHTRPLDSAYLQEQTFQDESIARTCGEKPEIFVRAVVTDSGPGQVFEPEGEITLLPGDVLTLHIDAAKANLLRVTGVENVWDLRRMG